MAQREVSSVPTLMDAVSRVRMFPDDLKTIRTHAEVTQVDLADLIGVHEREIQRWERGTHFPRDPVALVSLMLWAEQLRSRSQPSAS